MNYLFLLIAVLFTSNSYSFDFDKCKEKLYYPITKKLGSGPVTWISISSISPTSSSQYISSSGSCSSLAIKEYNKKEFIVHNMEPLMIDLSRGFGEYLSAYSILLGCKPNSQDQLSFLLQKNFIYIYGENLKNSPEEVFESLEKVLRTEIKLYSNCKLEV